MDVNEQRILDLIRQGEGITSEFKTCQNQLSRHVYETVCAFLNRQGGTILLGVQDSGAIQGIDPDAVAQVRKDFVTAVNNPLKINPPAYLAVDEARLKIKSSFVSMCRKVRRFTPNGRIFDRNEDGKSDITDNTRLVAEPITGSRPLIPKTKSTRSWG
jgi:ATP-dependent DNA helicase RecG